MTRQLAANFISRLVTLRCELELRQKLTQRDDRVAELKQELAAKNRTIQELQRRPADAPSRRRIGGAAAAAAGAASAPGAVSYEGVRALGSSFRIAEPVSSFAAAAQQEQRQEEEVQHAESRKARSTNPSPRGVDGSAAAAVAADGGGAISRGGEGAVGAGSRAGTAPSTPGAAGEQRYLAHQIAQLRIQLAKRDAEVQRLEGGWAQLCVLVHGKWGQGVIRLGSPSSACIHMMMVPGKRLANAVCMFVCLPASQQKQLLW